MSFDGLWSDLEQIGRHPDTGGYRRYAWTREDHDLREWFVGACSSRGLSVTEDRMGNQWAWWGDPEARPGTGVVTGSHLDSVPDGGAFDGPLGVISALAAVDVLQARGSVPDRPLGIVNFVDEEGARFGVACAGSRVITGAMTGDHARCLTDADGVSMAQAWRAAGRDPAHLGPDPEALSRVGTFVELHVEQGRALADTPYAVGVGRHIWPHGRWRLDFTGEANHAGTTRMADRSDAMIGLARTVLAARTAAERNGCVATVGKVAVHPGGVNAVASATTAWLDARGADETAVRATVAEVAEEAAAAGGVVREESWTATTQFDARLADRLQRVLGDVPALGTGAGHDAGILATAGIPSAMIFVRNPTGISHSPAEWAERDDCLAGVDALVSVITDLTES